MLGTDTSSRAQVEIGSELGGRFSHLTKTVVTGVPQVPRQPPNSPFHHDAVPPEEPLGIDVNAMSTVGTPSEVSASIAAELQKAIEQGSKVKRELDTLPGDPPLKRRV